MRRSYKILAAFLAAALCLSMTACGSQQQDSLVYLNYGTGLDPFTDNYNTDLYGFNGNDVEAPDPGCFYVSEEEDPQWGGYFYMYPTSFATNDWAQLNGEYYKENGITNLVAGCYRSRDLYNWELCGALEGGYVCVIDKEDWCQNYWWAPEVIRNPADGKYYLYFSAMIPQDWGVEGFSTSSSYFDRLHLGVAVSDTPVGPFDVLYDIDPATGKRIPTINFHTGCNTEHPWSVIDVNPFFDDNGDFYLYFNKHTDDHYSQLNGIWGMKMVDMTHPDYSTVSCLTQASRVTASSIPGQIEEVETGAACINSEGSINEAPYMVKHNGKYYITYAPYGFSAPGYGVLQAVSDDPLTGFVKLDGMSGNPVMDGSMFGHMNGTGHHAFAKKGDQLYVIYHRHDSKYGWELGYGRSVCADKVNFVTNADGLDVLTANGPSKSLQWLEEDISGYKNLAESADIQISAGTGVRYLNDTIVPYYPVVKDWVMSAEEEEVTITLSWDKPVSVSSVMIYNSKDIDSAFSQISDIRFKLAEKPDWASRDYDYAVIQNLKLPERYYDVASEEYIPAAPAVAEFDPIMVTEIKITLKGSDKYIAENKLGEKSLLLHISEIVVLGGAS